jgi:hypothetical protein
MRTLRILEIGIASGLTCLGVAALFSDHPARCILLFGLAALVLVMFELRFRGHRRTIARVRDSVASIASKQLEQATPVAVRERHALEEEVGSSPMARVMTHGATRFFSRGKLRGHSVDLGSAVIAGRDGDVVVSHVLVEETGVRTPFRAMTKGFGSKLVSHSSPVTTGDERFDHGWIVDGPRDLATAVLDDGLRQTLTGIPTTLGFMQTVSIEATSHGLMVRFPGGLTEEQSAFYCDLAIRVRDRLMS